ncbi:MAG: hypothetical protein AB7N29_14755 [Vicinamibacterales bacterium]
MALDVLSPRIELVKQEYVLVQAWKKTVNYIRYHNWYSDTLALDTAAVNLPTFIGELREQLANPTAWTSDPLRMVPAPKSQAWRVAPETGQWAPAATGQTESKLRPLAHVSLRDQVAATAVMMCLADRVETRQGDPRTLPTSPRNRRRVISYGNRLFCDLRGGVLRHRWGSVKLYRAYYQDYRAFLARPEIVAEKVLAEDGTRVVVVHSDLKQFFDRVRPELLAHKLRKIGARDDDEAFYQLAERLFNWRWSAQDQKEAAVYAAHSELPDFTKIALPQGLVASGFFANCALLDFDEELRSLLGEELEPGVRVHDVSRYVDDLRFVLTADSGKSLEEIARVSADAVQTVLDRTAEGLKTSREKTIAAAFRGDERPLVRQSRRMERIQRAVSGGFDAVRGEEILEAVQGLIRSQQRYAEQRTETTGWSLSPIPDVRDATVARFAAARFRSTYRSLRPLLPLPTESVNDELVAVAPPILSHGRTVRTQADLDDDARSFALGLIEDWVEDPSNVRLLRVGLDLWPSVDILKQVLDLLRPFTQRGGRRKAPRRVAWYCLSEVFRAGATETGFVENGESLPAGVDISAYRSLLAEEGVRLSTLPARSIPWYLRQQVFLFLAATDPSRAPIVHTGRTSEMRPYKELVRFLRGEGHGMKGMDFASLAILSRRSFGDYDRGIRLALKGLTPRRFEEIAERDPSFALELLPSNPNLFGLVSPRLRDDLSLDRESPNEESTSLAEVVLRGGPRGPARNEISVLSFAAGFLETWTESLGLEALTPSDVFIALGPNHQSVFTAVTIRRPRVTPTGSMYQVPPWCPPEEAWRFQLGYLLRFILAGREDFTKTVRRTSWRESASIYRIPESHWYQRRYGLFNGHSGFGDDWLPISGWTEDFLSALLEWPGSRGSASTTWLRQGIDVTRAQIDRQIAATTERTGDATGLLMLPISAPLPSWLSEGRPLRACVVQTVIPEAEMFQPSDLTLSAPALRKQHRNHLSAALAAVERMLALRETHKGQQGRLDWLLLPELSVHPQDVKTHLIPFARAHKAIILAGLTYEEIFPGEPVVNSALWIIPVWTETNGLQVVVRRQGKQHLAPLEHELNNPIQSIQGFRPAQWLVGYDWSKNAQEVPLWLTASVCYDATDLRLAADLRDRSDVFAVPALNQDVGTFDQMAMALHYHMFQMVVVANNGAFGGSNAHAPYKKPYRRQVFHLHGQPQASIAFVEIEDIGGFLKRRLPSDEWKSPPAGLGWPPTK